MTLGSLKFTGVRQRPVAILQRFRMILLGTVDSHQALCPVEPVIWDHLRVAAGEGR
jgi:hypothetical protein